MSQQTTPGDREYFHIGENYYATVNVDERPEAFPQLHALRERLRKIYRAEKTDKIADRADSGQIKLVAAGERPFWLWSWRFRRWAIGVLICVVFGAMPLLYSYREQFGELLIQLGQQLAPKPAMRAATSPSVPVQAPVTNQQLATHPQAPIPLSRYEKRPSPSFPRATEAQPPKPASAEPDLEASSTPVLSSLPTTLASVPTLALSEPVGPAQPEAASRSPRDTEDLTLPYANSSAGKYFDVGKFRDAFRANQAIDSLGQLGFHAIIVRGRLLWMTSYHILVGPYSSQQEVEAARNRLEFRGLNPQVLRNRSRRFSLPPMTLYGTDVTVRDCVITWELNSPDATVEFMQGRNVVATTKARWEKRDFEFKTNAVVSRESDRGPKILLEIQRAGMDEGLVLDGSVLRFYMNK